MCLAINVKVLHVSLPLRLKDQKLEQHREIIKKKKTACIKCQSGEKLPLDKHCLLNICFIHDPRESIIILWCQQWLRFTAYSWDYVTGPKLNSAVKYAFLLEYTVQPTQTCFKCFFQTKHLKHETNTLNFRGISTCFWWTSLKLLQWCHHHLICGNIQSFSFHESAL